MAGLMETARAAFQEAEVADDVLAPDEHLLKGLQDLYLKHDKAIEAITNETAAVEELMKRFQKKASKAVIAEMKVHVDALEAAVLLAGEANLAAETVTPSKILLTNARANLRAHGAH